jgi:hypothetical protein
MLLPRHRLEEAEAIARAAAEQVQYSANTAATADAVRFSRLCFSTENVTFLTP